LTINDLNLTKQVSESLASRLKKKNLLALTKVWVICNSKTRADRKKQEAFSATADKNYSETANKSEATDTV
jgi:hypothetical protein